MVNVNDKSLEMEGGESELICFAFQFFGISWIFDIFFYHIKFAHIEKLPGIEKQYKRFLLTTKNVFPQTFSACNCPHIIRFRWRRMNGRNTEIHKTFSLVSSRYIYILTCVSIFYCVREAIFFSGWMETVQFYLRYTLTKTHTSMESWKHVWNFIHQSMDSIRLLSHCWINLCFDCSLFYSI